MFYSLLFNVEAVRLVYCNSVIDGNERQLNNCFYYHTPANFSQNHTINTVAVKNKRVKPNIFFILEMVID